MQLEGTPRAEGGGTAPGSGVHHTRPTPAGRPYAGPVKVLSVVGARPQFVKLAPVAAALDAAGVQHVIVHTSGRHGLAVLDPAAAVGAHVLAMHPAMTFSGTALDLGRLPGCVFGVTANPDTAALAETLVADLQGTVMWVPEGRRTLYHAALAHGANHLVTLVAQAMDLLAASGSTDPAGTLRPLLTAALDNALAQGDGALTGPIVRGDVETVRAHLADIASESPDTLESYVAMARATANRAALDGRLLPIRAAKLVGILNDALVPRPGARPTTVGRRA